MRKLTLIFLTILLTLSLAACGGTSGPSDDEIATVGDRAISKKEFDAQLGSVEKSYKAQGQPWPEGKALKNLKNQVLDAMIQNEIILNAAEKEDIKVSDKEIDKQVKEVKKMYFQGDEKAFEKELKKQGLTEKTMRDRLEATLVMQKLQEKITKSIKVSQKDIQDYYAKNKTQFALPKQREVAHILVKDQAAANKVLAEYKAGADFDSLAKKYSLDPATKNNGGKMTASAGQLVKSFEDAAFKLKTGDISAPVKTEFGYHIIKALSNTRPAKAQTLKEAQEQIESTLQSEQQTEKLTKYLDKLRRNADVKTAKGYSWKPTANKAPQPVQ